MSMWILGSFSSQVQSNVLLYEIGSSQYFQFSKQHFPVLAGLIDTNVFIGKSRNGLCCNALKTKKKTGISVPERAGPETDENFDFQLMDYDSDDADMVSSDDEGDDEVFVPLKNMKKWLENKPRGFGEGKVYDTSIEDKLMEEIEQSRKANLANLNRLKNTTMKPVPEKDDTIQIKGSTKSWDCFRVRLLNLPKKKNIHRDLQTAFNGFPGMLDIVPVVSGNKKTRDPICKGVAFINLKYENEAQSFVQEFSGKRIIFGKIEKQIKCEVMSPTSGDDASEASDDGDDSMQVSWGGNQSHELDGERSWVYSEEDEEINGSSEMNIGEESSPTSSSSEQRQNQGVEKKVASKRRKEKSPKNSNNLGSANRLKIREKAMFTGVLSKYGTNTTSSQQRP